MADDIRLIDSFQTKYGYTVSLEWRGKDLVLKAHNGSRYFEFTLGPGDAHRLASSLSAASTSVARRGKLTLLKGGTDAKQASRGTDPTRGKDMED